MRFWRDFCAVCILAGLGLMLGNLRHVFPNYVICLIDPLLIAALLWGTFVWLPKQRQLLKVKVDEMREEHYRERLAQAKVLAAQHPEHKRYEELMRSRPRLAHRGSNGHDQPIEFHAHYVLDAQGEAVPFDGSIYEWAVEFEYRDRCVKQTNVGLFRVSTVFLGLNSQFFPGMPPQIFETMIFTRWKVPRVPSINKGEWSFSRTVWWGAGDLDYQERYATRSEALAGHKEAIRYAWRAHRSAAFFRVLLESLKDYGYWPLWLIFREENNSRIT